MTNEVRAGCWPRRAMGRLGTPGEHRRVVSFMLSTTAVGGPARCSTPQTAGSNFLSISPSGSTHQLPRRVTGQPPLAARPLPGGGDREARHAPGRPGSAPTSKRKTVVATTATSARSGTGAKVIYTTPLKALSNQSSATSGGRLGARHVRSRERNTVNDEDHRGDDNEILRNVITRTCPLDQVRYVVLDEVHYIDDFPADRCGGGDHPAPSHNKLVGMSATIGKYAEPRALDVGEIAAPSRPSSTRSGADRAQAVAGDAETGFTRPLRGGRRHRTSNVGEATSRRRGERPALRGFRHLPSNDLLRVVGELRRMDLVPGSIHLLPPRLPRGAVFLQRFAPFPRVRHDHRQREGARSTRGRRPAGRAWSTRTRRALQQMCRPNQVEKNLGVARFAVRDQGWKAGRGKPLPGRS